MLFAIFIVLLLILVVFYGSTSYGPKLLTNYVKMSVKSEHPQMEADRARAGISMWQLATLGTKEDYIRQLQQENKEMGEQIRAGHTPVIVPMPVPAATQASPSASTPNSAAASAPAAPTVPVVAPTPNSPAPSSATAAPTPVVEKFRTNLAQMFGGMHA